jgi:hypothetical protein
MQLGIQLARRTQVVPEGLFHRNPRVGHQLGLAEVLHDRAEQ